MSESSSEGYQGNKKNKKKSSSHTNPAQNETKKQPVHKNSTALPPSLSRRDFLRRAAAAGIGVAALGTVGTVAYLGSQESEPTPAPASVELTTATSLEEYLKITSQLKELENKYKPNEIPNFQDPEFIADAKNALKLTYSMCNSVLPEWASDSVYDNTQLCLTPAEFIKSATQIDSTGTLRSVLEDSAGGVTYGGVDRHIIFNTFNPDFVTTYGRSGLGPLSFLRNIAAHEWGHYISKQQLLPESRIFTLEGVTFKSTNGLEFAPNIPTDASSQVEMLTGLNELLTDEEMLKVQTDAGFNVLPIEIYAQFGDRVNDLYAAVGQNRADHQQLLYDFRKNGDPVGMIEHFAGFVDKAKELSDSDRTKWGATTFTFALKDMKEQRDILLAHPYAIRDVAMTLPQPSYSVKKI